MMVLSDERLAEIRRWSDNGGSGRATDVRDLLVEVDRLRRDYDERLRVNVGLLAENRALKAKLAVLARAENETVTPNEPA